MNRRHFLVGATSGVAAFTGLVSGQAPAAPAPPAAGGQAPAAPAAGRQGGGGGRGRGGSPANVPDTKLARLSMMTLNHGSMLKLPWSTTTNENQTIALLDLPQYYIDVYGIRNVEFQNNHLAQGNTDPDPVFFREFKAKFDAVGSKAVQINIEIGGLVGASATPDARAAWLTRAKKWVDTAPIMGITRLMINQSGLNDENKAGVVSIWKEIQDYARPKNIMISAETRGSGPTPPGGGGGGRGRRGAAAGEAAAPPPPPPPPAPPISETERLRHVWVIVQETIEAAGGYSNLDFGGAGRFKTQQQLHDAIKGMLPRSAGSMHVKSSPDWDIASAVRYAESLGYKGLWTIEVNPDPAIRIVYNTILSAIA